MINQRRRRKIYYVDRIFQKKIHLFFLGLILLAVSSNIKEIRGLVSKYVKTD